MCLKLENKKQIMYRKWTLKHGMSINDLWEWDMEFGNQGGQAHQATAISAPSLLQGHPSLCGAHSVSPEHHLSCWKLINSAFSCQREISIIIQEFICRSTVSNFSTVG